MKIAHVYAFLCTSRRAIALIAGLSGATLSMLIAAPAAKQLPPLSLVQIEQLMTIKAPDTVIAREITTRGLAFAVDRSIVDDLQGKGAGTQTLGALRSAIPHQSLTVISNVPGVEVLIDGISRGIAGPDGRLSLSDLEAGTYKITARRHRCREATVEATLLGKAAASVAVTLWPDPDVEVGLINAASEALRQEQYDKSIVLAKDLQSLDSLNADAVSTMAGAWLGKGQPDEFVRYAKQTLDVGGEITFMLRHHHGLNSELHSVTLRMGANTFGFDPQKNSEYCRYPAFTLPSRSIVAVDVTGDGREEIYLHVKIADPAHPKKTADFNFADMASYFVKGQKPGLGGFITYQGYIMKSRLQAFPVLSAIGEVLQYSRRPLAASGAMGSSQSAKAVVEEAIRRQGGLDAILSVRSLIGQGTVELLGKDHKSGSIVSTWVAPDKLHQVATISGKRKTSVFDGATSWESDSKTSPRQLPADVTSMIRSATQAGIPALYHHLTDPAVTVSYRRSEIRWDRLVHVLCASDVTHETTEIYFDAISFLPLGWALQSASSSTAIHMVCMTSDFMTVQGISLPRQSTTWANGNRMQTDHISEFKVNVAVDDTIFQRPPR